jgi:CYTH domain-containing protein
VKSDYKTTFILKKIRDAETRGGETIMSEEIEKKFLLRKLPRGLAKATKILQGYLNIGDPEVRVRAKGEKFFLTRKGGMGFVREEEEYEISKEVFDILWSLTKNARIKKTRYEIVGADGLIWEIDEFQTASIERLFIAEVELPDKSVIPEIPPAIIEVIEKDVTLDETYKNKNLATNETVVEK